MGNFGSSLSDCRYDFEDPKIGDFDLSRVKVYIIDSEQSADAAERFFSDDKFKVLYVDCEGHCFGSASQRLGTVQVATGPYCCLIFHITRYRDSLDFLKRLFESDEVRKVFHDCSGDSAVLFHENQINLRNVDDTQVAQKVIESSLSGEPIENGSGLSLADLYLIYCRKEIPGNKHCDRFSNELPGMNKWIFNSELTENMIKYAVMDVLAVYHIFSKQEKLLRKKRWYRRLVQKQLEKKITRQEVEIPEEEELECKCIIS